MCVCVCVWLDNILSCLGLTVGFSSAVSRLIDKYPESVGEACSVSCSSGENVCCVLAPTGEQRARAHTGGEESVIYLSGAERALLRTARQRRRWSDTTRT